MNHSRAWVNLAAFGTYALLTFFLSFAYQALPDVDSYYWYNGYGSSVADPLQSRRPLFFIIVRILDILWPFTTYDLFKYVLPAVSSVLIVPAWLMARRMSSPPEQILILLLPLANPAFILLTHSPIPTAFLLIGTSALCYFLLYAHRRRSSLWFGLAGIIAWLLVSIHELGWVAAGWWLVAAPAVLMPPSWGNLRRRYIVAGLVIIALGTLCIFLAPAYIQNLTLYAQKFFEHMTRTVGANLSFPATYINIDGQISNWPGPLNITRYYLFYASPAMLAALGLTIYGLAHSASIRDRWRSRLTSPSLFVIVGILGTYLVIAELLPRILGIAVLPDRAWIMASAFLPLLVIYLLENTLFSRRILTLIFLALIIISAAGALYINYQNRYHIPDYHVQAAEWLAQHAPYESFIVFLQSSEYIDSYLPQTTHTLDINDVCSDPLELSEITSQLPGQTPLYLFTYADDPKSPYRTRPWYRAKSLSCTPSLTAHGKAFEPIYADEYQTRIWQIR